MGVKISFKTTEPSFADSNLYKHLPKSQQNVTSRCEKNLVKRQLFDRKRLQNETLEMRKKRLSRQRDYKRKIQDNEKKNTIVKQ